MPSSTSGLVLQHGDGARHTLADRSVLGMHHVVGQRLAEGLDRFHGSRGRRELIPDNRLVNEWLAEDFSLPGPHECVGECSSHLPQQALANHPALMVEVIHDQLEALVLLAQQVAHRHQHVVEDHQGSPAAGGVGGLDLACVHRLRPLDQQHRDAAGPWAAGAHGRDEVVCIGTLCDPLLDPVDNVVLAIRGLSCSGLDGSYIAAGKRLTDGEATPLLALQQLRTYGPLHLFTAEVVDCWRGDKPARPQ
mmetsp:Transcript_24747/g.39649  ORF Transcript_24747/g.39649 Transcript_24747/m.39649 type:complete len:249 (+) Transcript_24747:276-1022(+)